MADSELNAAPMADHVASISRRCRHAHALSASITSTGRQRRSK